MAIEPMSLGSPGSPMSGSNPYLPSFLTGEIDAPTTPRNNTLSPTKRRTLTFAASPPSSEFNASLSSHGQQQKTLFGRQQQNVQNISFQGTPVQQKLNVSISGPPTQGLFDSLREEMNQIQTSRKSVLNETHNPIGTPAYNKSYNKSYNESFLNQSNFNASRMTSPVSNCGSNIRNTQFEFDMNDSLSCPPTQKYAEFWVTVFGFPTNATSMILSHFSQCGSIIDKVFPSPNGNWIHIKYSSRLECDKALNYNEKILNNNIMIGVTRCKDPGVIDKDNLNDNNQFFKIRPLSQVAYNNKQCESAVVTCSPAPQRSSGIMNKAMDLLFGW